MSTFQLKYQITTESWESSVRHSNPLYLVQKHTRIKIYKTLAILTYGSEAWTICKSDRIRITAYEMKFLRRTAK
jgi:hypothetical protein